MTTRKHTEALCVDFAGSALDIKLRDTGCSCVFVYTASPESAPSHSLQRVACIYLFDTADEPRPHISISVPTCIFQPCRLMKIKDLICFHSVCTVSKLNAKSNMLLYKETPCYLPQAVPEGLKKDLLFFSTQLSIILLLANG